MYHCFTLVHCPGSLAYMYLACLTSVYMILWKSSGDSKLLGELGPELSPGDSGSTVNILNFKYLSLLTRSASVKTNFDGAFPLQFPLKKVY